MLRKQPTATTTENVGMGLRTRAEFERLPESVKQQNPEVAEIFDVLLGMHKDVSIKDLHGFYTELGRAKAKGNLPGDVYATLNQTRRDLGELIGDIYKSEGKYEQWTKAKEYWHQLAEDWWNTKSLKRGGSPLAHSLMAKDPSFVLDPLTGKSSTRANAALARYQEQGGNSNVIRAAQTLKTGRALLSHPLWSSFVPAYFLHAIGVPYAATLGIDRKSTRLNS